MYLYKIKLYSRTIYSYNHATLHGSYILSIGRSGIVTGCFDKNIEHIMWMIN